MANAEKILNWYAVTEPELYKEVKEAAAMDDQTDFDMFAKAYDIRNEDYDTKKGISSFNGVPTHILNEKMLRHSPHGSLHFPIKMLFKEDANKVRKILEYGFVFKGNLYKTKMPIG